MGRLVRSCAAARVSPLRAAMSREGSLQVRGAGADGEHVRGAGVLDLVDEVFAGGPQRRGGAVRRGGLGAREAKREQHPGAFARQP